MTDEYTIEMASPDVDDWEEALSPSTYFEKRNAAKWPLGIAQTGVQLYEGANLRFRRVPADPLLKAMVLAQMEGK